jgi:hypothetical protein
VPDAESATAGRGTGVSEVSFVGGSMGVAEPS